MSLTSRSKEINQYVGYIPQKHPGIYLTSDEISATFLPVTPQLYSSVSIENLTNCTGREKRKGKEKDRSQMLKIKATINVNPLTLSKRGKKPTKYSVDQSLTGMEKKLQLAACAGYLKDGI